MTFIKQFTGKPYWVILSGLVVLDVLSFLTIHSFMEVWLFGAILGLALYFATVRPEWLLPLAIAEIIATSNGHSADIDIFGVQIGIRIMLFAVLMTATIIKIWKTKKNPIPERYRIIALLLATLLVYGLLRGVFGGYDVMDVYLDSNGYLAIGYVLAAFVWIRDSKTRQRLLQAVGAGVTWITVKTLALLFLFGHLHPKTLDPLYLWIRDTRLGEITIQRGNMYRVFLQSQWYLIAGVIASASYMLFGERKSETGVRVIFMVILAALIASLSRSFAVALLGAGSLLALFAIYKQGMVHVGRRAGSMLVVGITSIALLWVILAVPIFQTVGTDFFGALKERTHYGTDVAIDSRRQLLGPMGSAILEAPATGHGFGKNIWYQTSDPRFIDTHQSDIVSTYAFEWGWLDIWVKLGVVGVFVFVLLFVRLMIDLWHAQKVDSGRRWLYASLALSVIALYITHIFTPYLNHPLGWGMIATAIAIVPNLHVSKQTVGVKKTKKRKLSAQTANTNYVRSNSKD